MGEADCCGTAEETDEAECNEEKGASKIHDGRSLLYGTQLVTQLVTQLAVRVSCCWERITTIEWGSETASPSNQRNTARLLLALPHATCYCEWFSDRLIALELTFTMVGHGRYNLARLGIASGLCA